MLHRKCFPVYCLVLLVTGCSKSGFLNTSPSSELIQPVALAHFSGLLNDVLLMGETPVMGEQSADNYYLSASYYKILPEPDKNLYTWQKDVFSGVADIQDWNIPYKQVAVTNTVLDGIDKITPSPVTQNEWNQVKGTALFMRSYAFHNLAQVFAPVYEDKQSALAQPGIVLPLTADVNVVYARATMQQTYQQIIKDLLVAKELMPVSNTASNRPGKAAVCALLARVYLSMSDYRLARDFADSALYYHASLIDFNTLNLSLSFPVPKDNAETLYQSWLMSNNNIFQGRIIKGCIIDSTLYNQYDNNDLRKTVYFMPSSSGLPIFRSSYSGNALAFSGLATDEVLLTRAECNARLGYAVMALDDINRLLLHRYRAGTFTAYKVVNDLQALAVVLTERRKELLFRGLRWSDLKRLNKGGAEITLYRKAADKLYQLPPNHRNYILPIPDNAIAGSNIIQNLRDQPF
jgi:starch-binding outer membrane protein, SusD/RagB family